jgi:GMP synthase-like glutamine amidotransferase
VALAGLSEVGWPHADAQARQRGEGPLPRDHHGRARDQVASLPPGAQTLASTDHCPHAVIAVGERVLGIQGHPELSAEYVAALVDTRRDRIGAEKADAALASLAEPRDEAAAAAWMTAVLEGAAAADAFGSR